jgi:hypothetical protein
VHEGGTSANVRASMIEIGIFVHSFYTSDLMRKDVAEARVPQDGTSLRTD